jgi:hypothetical protein
MTLDPFAVQLAGVEAMIGSTTFPVAAVTLKGVLGADAHAPVPATTV